MDDYKAKTWFQSKSDDPQNGHLWMKARILSTFKRRAITGLYLFEHNRSDLEMERSLWSNKVHNSIRILFDRIVTRWIPNQLIESFAMKTVTPEPLLTVPLIFDSLQSGLDFDVEKGQERYEKCFVPLLYHELWENIKKDVKSLLSSELFNRDGDINIQIIKYESTYSSETCIKTTLIFGSYSFETDLSFTRVFPKLGLGDIVLINIKNFGQKQSFFAVIVHVFDQWPENMNTILDKQIINIKSDIVLYVSKKCSNAITKKCNNSQLEVSVLKLSNITSIRRQISAICNLEKFTEQENLLMPTDMDPFFQYDNIPNDLPNIIGDFNDNQINVIKYAIHMFREEKHSHLHLVHGPPGTGKSKTIAGIVIALMPLLKRNKKILLCAPSNNACDELFKRIFNELKLNDRKGKLVRVGREAPLDHDVCEYFLESLIMQQLVRMTQNREAISYQTTDSIKEDILKKAKVIVSTLNYSANNTLLSMKKQQNVEFIIIDEACQSLEADCLLPFYFGCSKIILVGDPKQLPPCVLSPVGQKYNLSQSLYKRLYDLIPSENISMLTKQYRMHKEICHFPNTHFYESQLETDESVMNYWPDYRLEPYYLYDLTYTRHTCPPNGGSSSNKEERNFIKNFCVKLLEHLVDRQPYDESDQEFIEMEKRIVVITPYKAQMNKFRNSKLKFPRHIEVLTVDSAQGKEQDIVLISCVRSGETIGFLSDEHRLNVMLTRAKRALYIFGNLTWLAEQNSHWDALVDDATNRQVITTVRNDSQEITLPFP
ncbi:hypothetical protein I4U23_016831 [Adineta vaga]|nr:hypothetical protein I4U23_016831 [Adineta vaga]